MEKGRESLEIAIIRDWTPLIHPPLRAHFSEVDPKKSVHSETTGRPNLDTHSHSHKKSSFKHHIRTETKTHYTDTERDTQQSKIVKITKLKEQIKHEQKEFLVFSFPFLPAISCNFP